MTPIVLAFLVGISDMCMQNRDAVQRQYADAMRAGGHDAVLVFRTTDTNSLRRIVRSLDLVVMTGGADVAPARYGEANEKSWPDEKRDEFDFALMSACVAERKPILGICRGCQLVNVFFGGSLVQDLGIQWKSPTGAALCDHSRYPVSGAATNPPSHTVAFAAESRLAGVWGTDPVAVNSHHHQAVKAVAPGFRIVARAPDGVPEAIEHETLPIFGVQFHPELTVARRPSAGFDLKRHLGFFRALPALCRTAIAIPDVATRPADACR